MVRRQFVASPSCLRQRWKRCDSGVSAPYRMNDKPFDVAAQITFKFSLVK